MGLSTAPTTTTTTRAAWARAHRAFSGSHSYFSAAVRRGAVRCSESHLHLNKRLLRAVVVPSAQRYMGALLAQVSSHHVWTRLDMFDTLFRFGLMTTVRKRGRSAAAAARDDGRRENSTTATATATATRRTTTTRIFHVNRLIAGGQAVFRHCLLLDHVFAVHKLSLIHI